MSKRCLFHALSLFLVSQLGLASHPAYAEQMQQFGDWEVHYVVVPTTFLSAKVASAYDIVRGKDLALVNVSLIHALHGPSQAVIDGTATNLLSQQERLNFREVAEEGAVYYLTSIRYTDRDLLRFNLHIEPPGGRSIELSFDQKMYVARE